MANIALAKEMGPGRDEVPETVDEATTGLVNSTLTDPVKIMDVAKWWFRHGGASNPVYRWSITWLMQLTGSRVREGPERYRNAVQYLEELGYDV